MCPWLILHPLDSLVHPLKGHILVGLEFAHCTMVRIDRNLFFVVRLNSTLIVMVISDKMEKKRREEVYQISYSQVYHL